MASWSLAILLVQIVPCFAHSAMSPYEILNCARRLPPNLLVAVNELIKQNGIASAHENTPCDVLAHALQLGYVLPMVYDWIKLANVPEAYIKSQVEENAPSLGLNLDLVRRLVKYARNSSGVHSSYPFTVLKEARTIWYEKGFLFWAELLIQSAKNETDQAGVYQHQIIALAQKLDSQTEKVIEIINESPAADKAFQEKFIQFLLLVELDSDTFIELKSILNQKISEFRILFEAEQFPESSSSARDVLKRLAWKVPRCPSYP
uniref:Uncharacterized protein n=1 Tax=Spongospora subterranea TaxID=70186 RepID=A0A0H5R517_9EUKA|eukprot:CRZ08887.1 hypothetical protein [Spongospora subterranea]